MGGDDDVLIAANYSDTSIARSADKGKTWGHINIPGAIWYSVAYDNGAFVLLDMDNGKVARSITKGESWLFSALQTGLQWRGLAGSKGIFAAISTIASGPYNVVARSLDINVSFVPCFRQPVCASCSCLLWRAASPFRSAIRH